MTAATIFAMLPASFAFAADTALQTSVFASDDADDTAVVKVTAGALFGYSGPQHYQGVVAERMHVRAGGGGPWQSQRLYLAFARDGDIAWTGRVGSDSHTVLGNVSAVRESAVRQEYFVERDRLETLSSIRGDGIYQTFAGAAFDIPVDDAKRQQVTVLAGAQDFTGLNLRTHLRVRYVGVVSPETGLSLQLRTRAFRNTRPYEADYYSPDWFVEVMPAVQVRRFRGGWMYSSAAGWGRQRDSRSDWRQARVIELTVESPRRPGQAHFRVNALYSNTPVGNGASYGYRQLSLEWVKPL